MSTLPSRPVHRLLRIESWRRTRYRDATEKQRICVEKRKGNQIPDTLILTEHEPVYTIGARKDAEKNLVWSDSVCARMGVTVERTSRGGDITFHGPGQIVGYPIIDLRESRDLHRYLRDLEEVLIRALGVFNISAGRRAGMTGIWIDTRKIAAVGVAVRSWITWHGFALNVSTDLRYFNGIIPCGITDGTVTSMRAEIGDECPGIDDVQCAIVTAFSEVFERSIDGEV